MRRPGKQAWQVPNYRYEQKQHTYRRVKLAGDHDYYAHRQPASTTTQQLEATFDVTVDVPAIIDELIRRATRNQTGRSALLGGIATIKRRGRPKVLSERVVDLPLGEGYVLVEAQEGERR